MIHPKQDQIGYYSKKGYNDMAVGLGEKNRKNDRGVRIERKMRI